MLDFGEDDLVGDDDLDPFDDDELDSPS